MLGSFIIFHPKSEILSLQTFSSMKPSPPYKKEYRNKNLSFSLFYPQEMNVKQTSSSTIKIEERKTKEEIAIIQIITSFSSRNFESFAKEQLLTLCSSLDTQFMTFCPTIDSQQILTTKEGITGSIYYLTEVTKERISQKEVERGIKGPFFVFDLSSQIASGNAILLMYSPFSNKQSTVDVAVLRRLAEGIRIDKRKFKEEIRIPSVKDASSSALSNF